MTELSESNARRDKWIRLFESMTAQDRFEARDALDCIDPPIEASRKLLECAKGREAVAALRDAYALIDEVLAESEPQAAPKVRELPEEAED